MLITRIVLRRAAVAAAATALGPGIALPLLGQAYPPISDFLRIERSRLSIGEEIAEGPALFGTIHGVTSDGQGNIYVLDGSNHTVKSFSGQGGFLHAVGRAGRGPGDFLYPIRVWHDRDSSLYVIDYANGISRYHTAAGKLSYRERFAQELEPVDACRLGGRFIIGANYLSKLLHEFDGGKIVRSFGEPFRVDTQPLIQQQYDRENMLLACDERDQRIFVAEGHQSMVRAYEVGGRLLWESMLPEYSGYSVVIHHQLPNATAYFMGEFSTKSIVLASPEILVIQASRKTQRRRGRSGGMEVSALGLVTYVLSASTGAVLTKSLSAPFFVSDHTTLAGEFVAFNNDPFPQVFVTRLTPVRNR